MKRCWPVLAALAALTAVCLDNTAVRAADLFGTQVTGDYEFGYGATPGVFNLFDPANGFVPAGYGKSGGTAVTINPGTITFGISDPPMFNLTADFTGTTLTVSESGFGSLLLPPILGWTMTFTDPAFAGVSTTFDSFPNSGVTTSFSGDTITLEEYSLLELTKGTVDTATFDIDAAVPESATTAGLLALALAGLEVLKRSKFFPR